MLAAAVKLLVPEGERWWYRRATYIVAGVFLVICATLITVG